MCNHARACSTQRRFSGDWSLARRLALVAFVLDDPVHRLVRDLDTVEHLESDVVLLPAGVGMLVPEAALEHFLAAPTYAADAPDLGSGLQPLVRSRSRSALTLWCSRSLSRRGMLVRKTASYSQGTACSSAARAEGSRRTAARKVRMMVLYGFRVGVAYSLGRRKGWRRVCESIARLKAVGSPGS